MPQASYRTQLPISLSTSSPCLSPRLSRSWRTLPRLICNGPSPPWVSDCWNVCHLFCEGLVPCLQSVILNLVLIYFILLFILTDPSPIPDGTCFIHFFPRLHSESCPLALRRWLFLQLRRSHWGHSARAPPASLQRLTLSSLSSFVSVSEHSWLFPFRPASDAGSDLLQGLLLSLRLCPFTPLSSLHEIFSSGCSASGSDLDPEGAAVIGADTVPALRALLFFYSNKTKGNKA